MHAMDQRAPADTLRSAMSPSFLQRHFISYHPFNSYTLSCGTWKVLTYVHRDEDHSLNLQSIGNTIEDVRMNTNVSLAP